MREEERTTAWHRPSADRGVFSPSPDPRWHSTTQGATGMEKLPKKPSAKGPDEMFTGDVWFD
ncbi:hypothetical protein, partial [Streptomyces sp. NPDC056730]|uniref:hypothetical protein n=1 Tax=Streptomyces sp. NPDC056730 TaxID=3345929 RepID=UPI0036AECD3F